MALGGWSLLLLLLLLLFSFAVGLFLFHVLHGPLLFARPAPHWRRNNAAPFAPSCPLWTARRRWWSLIRIRTVDVLFIFVTAGRALFPRVGAVLLFVLCEFGQPESSPVAVLLGEVGAALLIDAEDRG
ncbi:hypothetical protein NMY22_g20303 [Coprinellus aureogranulatus]|nr:hypothetical protein NMY22_g20303 [Coprinellus aureogranulatus]